MPLTVSFDDAKTILARQVFGVTDADALDHAADAMELALQEIATTTHLIGQEGEGSLTLTGAGNYTLSSIDTSIIRIVKATTMYQSLQVMRKAEFVSKYPNHGGYTVGLPSHLVLWGDDNMYVWPDQADVTLNLLFYKIIDPNNAANLLWALIDIGRRHLDTAKETRAINMAQAELSLKKIREGETRSVDRPLRFLVEERVASINKFKRGRK